MFNSPSVRIILSSTNMIFNANFSLLDQDSETELLQNKRQQKWSYASIRKMHWVTLMKEQVYKKSLLCLKSTFLLDPALDICLDAVWPIDTWMPLNNQDFVHGYGRVTFWHPQAVQRLDECLRPGGMLRLYFPLSVTWRTCYTSSSQRAPNNKAPGDGFTVLPP